MRTKYLILVVVAAALILGCFFCPVMAKVVSIVAVCIYAFIVGVFVYPSIDTIKKPEDGEQGI
jgi:membrane protein implicated in regulation of membrane protease activity